MLFCLYSIPTSDAIVDAHVVKLVKCLAMYHKYHTLLCAKVFSLLLFCLLGQRNRQNAEYILLLTHAHPRCVVIVCFRSKLLVFTLWTTNITCVDMLHCYATLYHRTRNKLYSKISNKRQVHVFSHCSSHNVDVFVIHSFMH